MKFLRVGELGKEIPGIIDSVNKIDRSIIRHLIVKYKKLDLESEFFKKITKDEKKK